jgi:hypothetical protein
MIYHESVSKVTKGKASLGFVELIHKLHLEYDILLLKLNLFIRNKDIDIKLIKEVALGNTSSVRGDKKYTSNYGLALTENGEKLFEEKFENLKKEVKVKHPPDSSSPPYVKKKDKQSDSREFMHTWIDCAKDEAVDILKVIFLSY